MKIAIYLFGTLVVFTIATLISYHDGMAYDGTTSMGFPITFYTAGVGKSMKTGSMESFTNFYVIYLLTNIACSLLFFTAIRFAFRKIS